MSGIDYLIVGAGITGCTLAERLSGPGKNILIIDKRPHLGGNCYDEVDTRSAQLVHKYGPHIFHTNNSDVFNYLSAFTEWFAYEHKVEGDLGVMRIPIPYNLNSLHALWPAADEMQAALVAEFGFGAEVSVLELAKHPQFSALASHILDLVFSAYSKKQWGPWADKLDPSVFARVPLRVSNDDRYFTDKHQCLPIHGYTEMFKCMIAQPGITFAPSTAFESIQPNLLSLCKHIVYTGRIDEYFDFSAGELPYRSMHFTFDYTSKHVKAGTINYLTYPPQATRCTDFSLVTGTTYKYPITCTEYPQEVDEFHEPMYPVPTQSSKEMFSKYARLAALENNVHFCGRLGSYRYLNMDAAVAAALKLAEELKENEH